MQKPVEYFKSVAAYQRGQQTFIIIESVRTKLYATGYSVFTMTKYPRNIVYYYY